jgi:hypothetical protein
LDDCFASDLAVATLSPHFELQDFRVHFPNGRKGKENRVVDLRVIRKCHEEKWLLLTFDHNMRETHLEELKQHPCITFLATAHNSLPSEDYHKWLDALIKLKPTILKYYKKKSRPWFAVFTSDARISKCWEITPDMTTRRTRAK